MTWLEVLWAWVLEQAFTLLARIFGGPGAAQAMRDILEGDETCAAIG